VGAALAQTGEVGVLHPLLFLALVFFFFPSAALRHIINPERQQQQQRKEIKRSWVCFSVVSLSLLFWETFCGRALTEEVGAAPPWTVLPLLSGDISSHAAESTYRGREDAQRKKKKESQKKENVTNIKGADCKTPLSFFSGGLPVCVALPSQSFLLFAFFSPGSSSK
jgi:hypothetical protein